MVKLPKCTALYDYEARDIDELGLKEGDLLEIVKERMYKQVLTPNRKFAFPTIFI